VLCGGTAVENYSGWVTLAELLVRLVLCSGGSCYSPSITHNSDNGLQQFKVISITISMPGPF